MQQFDLAKELNYEELITSPVIIDGQSVRDRLKDERKKRLESWKHQEVEFINFCKKYAGKCLYYALKGFILIIWGITWLFDKTWIYTQVYLVKVFTKVFTNAKLLILRRGKNEIRNSSRRDIITTNKQITEQETRKTH